MTQPLHQVCAAVPCRRPGAVGHEGALGEEEFTPSHHAPPLVERKAELVHVHRVARCWQRAEVGVDRIAIGASDLGVEGVRHGRVHVLSATVHAIMQRAKELVRGPLANAGSRVGGNVGGQQVAEGSVHPEPAGARRATGRGMTRDAVTGAGEVLAGAGLLRRQGCCAAPGCEQQQDGGRVVQGRAYMTPSRKTL